jgi:hypothetical protein
MNMYWPRVKPLLQFIDRVYSWFNPMDTRALSCAFNKHKVWLKRSIRQYGGTGQIARGNAGLRHVDKGDDPTGLGCWVWQTFLGKDQKSFESLRPIGQSKQTKPKSTLYIGNNGHT